MTGIVFQLLGGIGLFLMGMVLLTDGLKAFAGDALGAALVRFTGTPVKAFASGALVTLMVQSSSATTVTLIGFVSAGLLTFPQAIGVVLGASLGTTGTGWVVSVLGLKVSLGYYAMPLVGVGALMRLLAHGRWRALGLALAGFALIFIGIDALQAGMKGLASVFDLARLPAAGWQGHLAAMVAGALMTVVMQSSSAAVATTLTALHTGAVNFDQAAALVIGAAIGTTVTGALAAIGGSVAARRTALTHVLFNLATGIVAIVLLPAFLWGIGLAQRHAGLEAGAVSLAAFHTAFIGLGVAIFLPFTRQFARQIERLMPERGPRLTRHLDDTLLAAPPVALEACRRTLSDIALELIDLTQSVLTNAAAPVDELRRVEAGTALLHTQQFFSRIPLVGEDEPLSRQRVSQLHAVDHLTRLHARLTLLTETRQALVQPALEQAASQCGKVLELARKALQGRAPTGWEAVMTQRALAIAELHREQRLAILQRTANGRHNPAEAIAALDATRWIERIAEHLWRICHYLADAERGIAAEDGDLPAPSDE
ncbi:MAG: Na/Pi symporter [Candidatus Nitrotoga sp.]|nr:Na/Pi symporter [Candidatus Nitrotoga sp.]